VKSFQEIFYIHHKEIMKHNSKSKKLLVVVFVSRIDIKEWIEILELHLIRVVEHNSIHSDLLGV
jgi:hypothetical protein